jgi:segregation and condensation protein A
LYLIKKEEVDIYEIPIAKITRQYLEYIDLMTTLNLEVAGEFILMAATLIRIKARLLLPRDETNSEEDDPREELIMALVEYKKFKEAGEVLKEKVLIEERNIVPPSLISKEDYKIDWQPGTSLFDLINAFKDVLKAKHDEAIHEVDAEEVSVEDRIMFVMSYLNAREFATFTELFADIPRRMIAVVTFLALLELCHTRRITVSQSKPYSELRVYRGELYSAGYQTADLIEFDNNKLKTDKNDAK